MIITPDITQKTHDSRPPEHELSRLIEKIRAQRKRHFPELDPETIHVWSFGLDLDQKKIALLKKLLDDDETNRAIRFKFLKDSQRYIASKAILRILLSIYTGIDPKYIIIKLDQNGKPFLCGPEDKEKIHFNASTSNHLAVYGFSQIKGIGVDIEKIRDIPEMKDIAAGHFALEEERQMMQCKALSRLDMFYRIWTCKEAVLKAEGLGLLIPLNSVDVSRSIDQNFPAMVNISANDKSTPIWVTEIKCQSGYRAALAAKNDFTKVVTAEGCIE